MMLLNGKDRVRIRVNVMVRCRVGVCQKSELCNAITGVKYTDMVNCNHAIMVNGIVLYVLSCIYING